MISSFLSYISGSMSASQSFGIWDEAGIWDKAGVWDKGIGGVYTPISD